MTCPQCGTEPCTCTSESLPHPSTVARTTYHSIPTGITKEEFGLNLYETVKTIGGIMGLDAQRASALHKQDFALAEVLLKRRRAVQGNLATNMTSLTKWEVEQVVAKYPWIVAA